MKGFEQYIVYLLGDKTCPTLVHYQFENNFGASITCCPSNKGYVDKLKVLTILKYEVHPEDTTQMIGYPTYNTRITNTSITHLDDQEILRILNEIYLLDENDVQDYKENFYKD